MPDKDRSRRKSFLTFGAPQIEQQEIDEVVDSLRNSWIGTGPKVKQFEEAFGQYKDQPHCVAVSSCTAALHLSLVALDLQPGDEVITSPLTFCATINAIIHAGGTPVLADVDSETMNICPEQIDKRLSKKTKAILPVHFAGRPCAMAQIQQIAVANDLKIVEDCAHAIETQFDGTHAGTMGDFGCFSFYATKNITTAEGGMILCKSKTDLERLRRIALHGLSHDAWRRFTDKGYQHYLVTDLGFKYNMTDIQAAIGIHQLKRIEQNLARRSEIWQQYDEGFQDLPIHLPSDWSKEVRHARHLYTIRVDQEHSGMTRDQFLQRMDDENIGTGVHYQSVAAHPYYQNRFGWKPEDTTIAYQIGQSTVSLPLSPALCETDVHDVISAVRHVVG
ncbi:MAG: DegT/DnrJ/EryC1/StrS family aminotransferase [Planctomycetota bacterium]